jgi:tetratricopeptide (TPR) repeat protein
LSYKLAQPGSCLLLSIVALMPLWADSPANTPAALFSVGSKQFNDHQFAAARESFSRVIELDARNAKAYRALGMTDLELKDYQAAYQAWLKAVALDPKDETSKYYLGRLFYQADLANEAAAWLREALKIAPEDFKATTYLGLCAEALGYDNTAVQLYRKAVAESEAQEKPYAEAYLNLGNFLRKEGNDEQALAVLQQGARKCPDAQELTALGELLARRNETRRAEEALRQAIALDPKLSQAHYRLALLLKSLGRADEARREMAAFQEAKTVEDQAPKITALRKPATP